MLYIGLSTLLETLVLEYDLISETKPHLELKGPEEFLARVYLQYSYSHDDRIPLRKRSLILLLSV